MSKKTLSIVIPAYCEEHNIVPIYNELLPVITSISGYKWEIIFVNDGSTDRTWHEIEQLCESDSRVK